MTAAVADVVDQDGHLVVQAGTGTGKSLAYLIPIALSGRRAVIATATKALQDQLAQKDLPFLQSQLAGELDFAVLKGRSNYLCLQRLDEAGGEDRLDLELEDLDGPLDATALTALRRFAAISETGDRAELSAAVSDASWRRVSVTREECPGASRCPRGDDCFAERARDRAAEAEVIITNLHLYALDVTIQGILPEHDLVVIDEVHQLEDVVSDTAGCMLTPGRLSALARTAASILSDRDLTTDLEDVATRWREVLAGQVGTRLTAGVGPEERRLLDLVRARTDKVMNGLRAVPEDRTVDVEARVQRVRQAATSLLEDIERLGFTTDDEVLWVDGPPSNPALRSTPVRVDDLLHEGLWTRRSAVLTSATITANLLEQLGLPSTTEAIDVGSPFDYESQAILYCPSDLPDPRSPDGAATRVEELELLMVAAGGRTLALFTSLAAMRDAAKALESRVPWDILVQGQRSKAALLEQFASDEETSLFATISFWQGVDVPGPACSLVVIDRLPFPRPDDPVLQARRDRAGTAAFRRVDLPRAATMLAQGVGRLIRSQTDRGVVAVLDPRLATSRGYRWDLIGALPPMRRTKNRDEVLDFLRRIRDHG